MGYRSGVLENGTKMTLAFSIIDETLKRGEKILFFRFFKIKVYVF